MDVPLFITPVRPCTPVPVVNPYTRSVLWTVMGPKLPEVAPAPRVIELHVNGWNEAQLPVWVSNATRFSAARNRSALLAEFPGLMLTLLPIVASNVDVEAALFVRVKLVIDSVA